MEQEKGEITEESAKDKSFITGLAEKKKKKKKMVPFESDILLNFQNHTFLH